MFGFGDNAKDMYGKTVKVGDTVQISGSCNQFVVIAVKYGGDLLDLQGSNYKESNVNSNRVIKVG